MMAKLRKIDRDTLLSGLLLYLILAFHITGIYVLVLSALFLVRVLQFKGIFTFPWWVNVIVLAIVIPSVLPVQRWLKNRINILIYGELDDPYSLLSQVSQQLQVMTAPDRTLPAVAEMTARRLKLPYLAIDAIQNNPQAALHVEWGHSPARTERKTLPLVYLEKSLGSLTVSTRRANEALTEEELGLLRDVAQTLGIALHTTLLTAELQTSREQLVIAREEERRRIRNDLHDGLAPVLSSLQLQLGALRALITQDPDQAVAIATDLREDLRGATAEIRQIAYELRPPRLDELGLIGSLRSLDVPGLEVCCEVDPPGPLPALSAAVEVAVYRIASEAIHNIIKHAQATECIVRIAIGEKQLVLAVTDNGQGFSDASIPGIGTRSMKERAAELGGTLTITPTVQGGACVTARIPIEV